MPSLRTFLSRPILRSTSLLIGAMVGVGVFGIPFAFSKSGFLIGAGLLVLIAALTIIVDLMYGEVILRTSEKHQLVGYADKYLGIFPKKVLFFAVTLTTYGALLAYIIIAGDFLHNLLSPISYASKFSYSIYFFIICSFLILAGIKAVAKVELVMSGIFAVVILAIIATGIGNVNFSNYTYSVPAFWFLPYGILLFAFAGLPAIPIQRIFLSGKESLLKKSIIWAVIFVAVLYLLFAAIVMGVSGEVTSPDAISGLFEFIRGPILILISLFGVVAVSTSYILLGSALTEVFTLDTGMKKFWGWFWTVIPPFGLFFVGIRTFIDVISAVGSIAIALELVILVLIFSRARSRGDRIPEYSLAIPTRILYLIAIALALGMAYAVIFI